MNLALFDFDGTITTEDTYTKFIFFATPKLRLVVGFSVIWPVIIFYKLGWLRASKTRPILSKVAFWRREVSKVSVSAERFVAEYLPLVTRKDVLDKVRWHKSQGDEVFVVSASLSPYLEIWCQSQGVNLICSELESKAGIYNGNYTKGDCSEERKVRYIKDKLDLSEYSTVYAYGDTDEDLPMLSIAHVKYFRGELLKAEC
ncbi:HAD-IB family hydrolase [Photobacterium kasasachensis]|uniref:HAD-IB family hydrolase n=1 Tax=Photobacterium kasasachensis TaxID=2910240 RepID=UPI003D1223C4